MHDLELKHAKIVELLAREDKIELTELKEVFDREALSEFYTKKQADTVQLTKETLTGQIDELKATIAAQRQINADLTKILAGQVDTVPALGNDRIEKLKDSIRYVLRNYIVGPHNINPEQADALIVGLMKHELGFVAPKSLEIVQFLVANCLVGTKPAGQREVILELW